MKKLSIILLSILLLQISSIAETISSSIDEFPTLNNANEPIFVTSEQAPQQVKVFCENNRFGLKDNNDTIIVPAEYQKMIMVGKNGWIIQKKNKFGLINSNGTILLEPKYRHVDRLLGRFVKIGNDNDFGIYDEYGKEVIPPIYNSIDLLYGRMFLTYRNFRYGVSDFQGNVLIPNICDDIYMPTKDLMKVKYLGSWYEISDVSAEKLAMPETITEFQKVSNSKVTDIVADTGAISGYSLLTFSDYFIKVFSSVSPAHEEAIDDLILLHGVDTIDILKKFSWVPKYPVTFAKKYYVHVRNPFNGPLSDIRYGIKKRF